MSAHAAGFLLRFEVPGTNVLIAGTKDGVTAAIFACSAKCEGGCPSSWGVWGASPENVRIFKAPGCILGHFWAIWLSVLVSLNKAFAA